MNQVMNLNDLSNDYMWSLFCLLLQFGCMTASIVFFVRFKVCFDEKMSLISFVLGNGFNLYTISQESHLKSGNLGFIALWLTVIALASLGLLQSALGQ